jgi:hypothetical protein
MKNQGLYSRYFVLKPHGDNPYAAASRRAMRSYSCAIRNTNAQLANALRDWADEEMIATPSAQEAGAALQRSAEREQR